jgi:UDP-N-acetylmuramate dehydrogenase
LCDTAYLKGFCIGGACVSSKHANFITNQDNATADDIENLIEHIQQTVKSKYDISLETEVVII